MLADDATFHGNELVHGSREKLTATLAPREALLVYSHQLASKLKWVFVWLVDNHYIITCHL
jgi:hypothetical protein